MQIITHLAAPVRAMRTLRRSRGGFKAAGPNAMHDVARRAASFIVLAAACLATSVSLAGPPGLLGGGQEETARQEAIRGIPFDKLDEPSRRRINGVLKNTAVFRQMPVHVVDSEPEMYLFLLRNPDVIVNIWELMGVSNVSVRRTAPYSFDGADGLGTRAQVDLLYGDRETHVMFADGYYEGPLIRRRLTGRSVMVMHTGYDQSETGRSLIASRMDVFVQVDSVGIELLAKTLQPFMSKTAETNFRESLKFVGQVSNAAERNGPGVEQLAQKLTQVEPEVRDDFARVAANIYTRAALRDGGERPSVRMQPSIASENPSGASGSQTGDEGIFISDAESPRAKAELRPDSRR